MCSRYLLRVAYDGSRFAEMAKGHTGCGVVHQLENVILYTLGKDSNMKVLCSPSSRTDKGVHALNNAILMKVYPKYDISSNKKEFLNKFNSTIDLVNPNGMKIIDYTEVSPGFCERRHVSYRIYTYRLAIAKDYDIYEGYRESTSLAYMSEKDYAWILPPGFDTGKAQEA
uniref:tRNA pseudouridine synthase n=1 Tax=Strongyloides papillosus TaxID=174720 RepID=A0A0N5BI60_STREA